jgi:hypothetical protein
MLDVLVKLMQNPWGHTIPDEALIGMFEKVATTRATHVEKMFEQGEWPRNSLGLAFLNPAAPTWQPTPETLLATIAIGSEGQRFVVNGIAKASFHRDHGYPAGYGVYMDLATSIDGDFCWGYSTKVDELIVGASGQHEIQDAVEAGHAGSQLLYYIRQARGAWKEQQPTEPNWFCNLNAPLEVYTAMAERDPICKSTSESIMMKLG